MSGSTWAPAALGQASFAQRTSGLVQSHSLHRSRASPTGGSGLRRGRGPQRERKSQLCLLLRQVPRAFGSSWVKWEFQQHPPCRVAEGQRADTEPSRWCWAALRTCPMFALLQTWLHSTRPVSFMTFSHTKCMNIRRGKQMQNVKHFIFNRSAGCPWSFRPRTRK